MLTALQEQLARFRSFSAAAAGGGQERHAGEPPALDAVPEFLGGRTLRDYQLESLRWHVNNLRACRNCILGDEMVRL